jgi:GNAT superfamily N-acetyltransferase
VTPTERELPVSFDQRMHVGAGDRPGSWMAISFKLTAPVDLDALASAWLRVVARHGTLRSVFVHGESGPRLFDAHVAPGTWSEHPIAAGQAVNDALKEHLDQTCRPYSAPSHRLCVVQTAAGPTVIVAADHSHVDMWSMLVIVRDLLSALHGNADLPSAPAFSDHTRALRERPAAPRQVHQRWHQIIENAGGTMPTFPLPLGQAAAHAERVEVRDVLDVNDSAAFSAHAAAEGVSTLALAVSAMTAVTQRLADAPLRAVFPVHSRYEPTWHDSVGWFITNSVIESADPAPSACAAAVKEAVHLGSWPLEPIMAPWGGMPSAPGMFAISWLDLRRLPVRVDAAGLEAQYVGAQIRTNGVMLWFILDEHGVHVRCRYPDTEQAREHVGRWLDAVVAQIQATARTSAGGRISVGGHEYRIGRASREDVAEIAALLADDDVARERESAQLATYEAAFDVVSRDPAQFIAVMRDEADRVVATMQMTIVPGLVRAGTTRLQIEGLRVAASHRSRGLGSAMLAWAHRHGAVRGATLAQITTDEVRARARAFYEREGYAADHVGLKRRL